MTISPSSPRSLLSQFSNLPVPLTNLIFQYSGHTPVSLGDLPIDAISIIKEMTGSISNFPACNRDWRYVRSELLNEELQIFADSVEENSILRGYLFSIDPTLSGHEKFLTLFNRMTADLGRVPESIEGLSRYSLDCYLRLSEEIRDLSFIRAWPLMRARIIEQNIKDERRSHNMEVKDREGRHDMPSEYAPVFYIRWYLSEPNLRQSIEKIKHLDLRNCGLLNIPREITLFKGLKVLDLSQNQIKSVDPKAFSDLTDLETFTCDQNQIGSLPKEGWIGTPVLRVLSLSSNPKIQIPAQFFKNFPSLSSLSLADCGLREIPPEFVQSNVRSFNLSGNPIDPIPEFARANSGRFILI